MCISGRLHGFFYDRKLRNHITLDSRKFEISDNTCKLHYSAHNNITFKNQMKDSIFNKYIKAQTISYYIV